MSSDWMHPNDEGYGVIANRLWEPVWTEQISPNAVGTNNHGFCVACEWSVARHRQRQASAVRRRYVWTVSNPGLAIRAPPSGDFLAQRSLDGPIASRPTVGVSLFHRHSYP